MSVLGSQQHGVATSREGRFDDSVTSELNQAGGWARHMCVCVRACVRACILTCASQPCFDAHLSQQLVNTRAMAQNGTKVICTSQTDMRCQWIPPVIDHAAYAQVRAWSLRVCPDYFTGIDW